MKKFLFAFVFVFTAVAGFSQYSISKVRSLYESKAPQFGLSAADVRDFIITSQYTDQTTGITHIYLRQVVQGKEIYDANSSLHINREGKVVHMNHAFYAAPLEKINTTTPGIDPVQALQKAASAVDMAVPVVFAKAGVSVDGVYSLVDSRISPEPVIIKPYYLSHENRLKLVWNVELYDPETGDWWNSRVDAQTGEVLERNNWTVHCDPATVHQHMGLEPVQHHMLHAPGETESGTMGKTGEGQYRILPMPVESPAFGEREMVSGSATSNGSPFGWHDTDGVAGPDFTITRGNNVYASEDTLNKNLPGFSPDGGVNLSFDFPYQVKVSKRDNLNAAITNVFYWNNLIHDVFYNYGFDEVSGNFQSNNYGKGGTGLDPVRADAQDGSGSNNANFSTPVDGKIPRMQMYLWSNKNAGTSNLKVDNGMYMGTYDAPPAMFGPPILSDIQGKLELALDGSTGYTACNNLTNDLSGKIALLYRGSTCNYSTKVLKAQNAGAKAVIVVNNNSFPPSSMTGSGAGVVIPSVMVSKSFGDNLKTRLLAMDSISVTLLADSDAYVLFDSDMDNAVITHEYGHGISNRLTGGPENASCLTNAEQAGEGWSDFFALCLTARPGDSIRGRGVGTWLNSEDTNGLGIRPYKYSRNMSTNPMTYNSIKSVAVPHGVGSVWCTMLYDAYWDMVDKYGFNTNFYETNSGGNNKMLQLVVDGLKYQPCNPGFIDARNAILRADSIRNGGANKLLLWKAFARRGLGWSAKQGLSSSNTDGTEGYDIPAFVFNGLAEENAWKEVSVYPNPSTHKLNIALPDMAGSVELVLVDMAGKEVLRQSHQIGGDATIQMDMESVEPGVYLLSVRNGKMQVQTKVIKN